MGPRRGDVVEERREGENVELGGRFTEIEGKIDALDVRVVSIDEGLTSLRTRFEEGFSSLEALIRSSVKTPVQVSNEKEKGALQALPSEIQPTDPRGEGPPVQVADSLQVPQGVEEGSDRTIQERVCTWKTHGKVGRGLREGDGRLAVR